MASISITLSSMGRQPAASFKQCDLGGCSPTLPCWWWAAADMCRDMSPSQGACGGQQHFSQCMRVLCNGRQQLV